MAYVLDKCPGMLLLESFRTSTGKYKANFKVFYEGGIITDPYWLDLEGSFYPYVSFLNFHGLIEFSKDAFRGM